jgi:hypothetical protein
MLYANSNLLYAHLKYGRCFSIYIMKAGFVAVCAYIIKKEQLQPPAIF